MVAMTSLHLCDSESGIVVFFFMFSIVYSFYIVLLLLVFEA
jgi:hypothetical protein